MSVSMQPLSRRQYAIEAQEISKIYGLGEGAVRALHDVSVGFERTRESGMLRAMGLKRGQVRHILALEGLALALLGVLVGIVLGILYGFAGATTLFGDTLGVMFSVPWRQIALISLMAVVSGLLASVLPARRALHIKPVEALANLG